MENSLSIKKNKKNLMKNFFPLESRSRQVLEIIFDIIIIATFRHLTNFINLHFFTGFPYQMDETLWFLAEFFIIWSVWFFFMHYINTWHDRPFRQKIFFILLFIGLGLHTISLYMFTSLDIGSSHHIVLTKNNLLRVYFLSSLSLMYIFGLYSFFFWFNNHKDNAKKFLKYYSCTLITAIIILLIFIIIIVFINNIETILKMAVASSWIVILIIFSAIFINNRFNKKDMDSLLEKDHMVERCAIIVGILISESFLNMLENNFERGFLNQNGWEFLNNILQFVVVIIMLISLWWIYSDRVHHIQITKARRHFHDLYFLAFNLSITFSILLLSRGLDYILFLEHKKPDENTEANGLNSLFLGLMLYAWSIGSLHATSLIEKGTLKKRVSTIILLDSLFFVLIFVGLDYVRIADSEVWILIYISGASVFAWWLLNILLFRYKY